MDMSNYKVYIAVGFTNGTPCYTAACEAFVEILNTAQGLTSRNEMHRVEIYRFDGLNLAMLNTAIRVANDFGRSTLDFLSGVCHGRTPVAATYNS